MLAAALQAQEILTVSQYCSRLLAALRQAGPAVLEGEVQKVARTGSGMLFFELTDGESLLSCKVFPREAARLEHRPAPGDLVQARVDRPDLYAARGSLSLIVSELVLAGEGELLRRRAELVERLCAEGLCDPARRRPLPAFPRGVGVIAGAGSDGMSDVIRALTDRWPAVRIFTCASLVQGKAAPTQLIDALARLQDHPLVDVIVLARGGGSVQDLACFDDERLCRALFACAVPVVCAIGHTDNNPVCNHVAHAAYTPSRSAELVVPSAEHLRRELAGFGVRLGALGRALALRRERIDAFARRLDARSAMRSRAAALNGAATEIERVVERALSRHLAGIDRARTLLDALPHRAARQLSAEGERLGRDAGLLHERAHRRLGDAGRELAHRLQLIAARDFRPRGWLLASHPDGAPVRSAAELRAGAAIDLSLHDGHARVLVEHTTTEKRRSITR
jgi:exodeoxyribonuclease VII large subunit